ncbi:MAG: WecB/TagA/CpsF family glycosyltransferase [Planctomycetota bacterium]
MSACDSLPTITLAGQRIHAVTMQQTLDAIAADAKHKLGGWVVTPNLDILHKLVHDESFRDLVAPASLFLPDGKPLIWASKLQRTPLPERVAGSDLISTLSERAASEGLSIFLLGGDPGAADEAADVLHTRHPDLTILGTECPPFGFENDAEYMTNLETKLTQANPDIVFVALGCPKQEKLITRLRPLLPNAWFLGVGISFSFLAGRVNRAPVWMQRTGLEWLHRLAQEPGRLARRYLVIGIPFAIRLLIGSMAARFRG